MLHITNGESTEISIRKSGVSGNVLAWKDVLHEGPVPAGFSLDQMSQARSRYIADHYQLPYNDVISDFEQRDRTLGRFREHEEVVLWFEHDLYDQLQLIQILDWFAERDLGTTRLNLICINAFPGIDHFTGLGQLTPLQLASLFPVRQEVTQPIFDLSRKAWKAFCASTPEAIEALLTTDTTALPFLKQALIRHLEEFPDAANGLSRTEKQILEVVVAGVHGPAQMFRADMEKEESVFMGDLTFWFSISGLNDGPQPLLKVANGGAFSFPSQGNYDEAFQEQVLDITDEGIAVLNNRADWIALHKGIDRWLGGVHLQSQRNMWRWDADVKHAKFA